MPAIGLPREATHRFATMVVVALAVVLAACAPDEVPPAAEEASPVRALPPVAAPPPSAPAQGLACIKGGSTREEVRAVMGEPDSVAFGDWLYGRSSVTFGYGVVLDYSNAGGNLVLCP